MVSVLARYSSKRIGVSQAIRSEVEMPYIGDLRRMGLLRLLDLLGAGRKSGLVRARSGQESLSVYLRRGRCEHIQPTKSVPVSDHLLKQSVESADDRQGVREVAGEDEVGTALLLDFLGLSSRESSLALAREQAKAILQKASDWQKGDFRFEPAVEPPKGRLHLAIPVSHLTKRAG